MNAYIVNLPILPFKKTKKKQKQSWNSYGNWNLRTYRKLDEKSSKLAFMEQRNSAGRGHEPCNNSSGVSALTTSLANGEHMNKSRFLQWELWLLHGYDDSVRESL